MPRPTASAANTTELQSPLWILWNPESGIGVGHVGIQTQEQLQDAMLAGVARGQRVFVLTQRAPGLSNDQPIAAWEWRGQPGDPSLGAFARLF